MKWGQAGHGAFFFFLVVWQRAGMREAARVCSSCSMHQCLWDGSPGLGPDGCQDTGWAQHPDIIKGLKWKPLGDYSICFSTTYATLISVHYFDGMMRGNCWATECRWHSQSLFVQLSSIGYALNLSSHRERFCFIHITYFILVLQNDDLNIWVVPQNTP